jgi:hypothetical protein
VKVKEINTFYFFEGSPNRISLGDIDWVRDSISYWCIIGSAQLPYDKGSSKHSEKCRLFTQKNNVFYIGSPEKFIRPKPKLPKYDMDPRASRLNQFREENYNMKIQSRKEAEKRKSEAKGANRPWHEPFESENRMNGGYGSPNLYMRELQEGALIITCEKCNSPPFYSCRTPVKRNNCKTHAIRKSGVQQILFVGKRRTGPGSYYYHRKKMYLAETLNDVTEFISTPDEGNESRTSRKSIPDDVQIFVWKRDGGLCVKCGSNENLAFDHIIPHSLGGSDTRRNLQILCDTCNSKKGNKIGG